MRTHPLAAVAALVLTASCSTRVGGSIEIDGRTAVIQRCASAEHARVDNAIDVTTSAGEFRFSLGAGNQTEISYLFSASGTIGGIPVAGQTTVVIRNCGPMTLTRADYMQNTVYPLSGSVTADCDNLGTSDPERHSFHGTFTFENCR